MSENHNLKEGEDAGSDLPGLGFGDRPHRVQDSRQYLCEERGIGSEFGAAACLPRNIRITVLEGSEQWREKHGQVGLDWTPVHAIEVRAHGADACDERVSEMAELIAGRVHLLVGL